MSGEEAMRRVLYNALGEPVGLLLHSVDTQRLRQAFYRLRAKLADPALGILQFRVLPQGLLAITKARAAQEALEAL